MPYRRPYKRPRYGKRDKYSIQQKASVATVAANKTSVVDIVPATTTEGMRKVKHLTCNLTQVTATGVSGGAESNLFWALVYVPQGTTAGALNVATAGATQAGPYSRSYQDLLSYLSQPQRRRQDLSSSVLLLMGRLQLSLSVCAMLSLSN